MKQRTKNAFKSVKCLLKDFTLNCEGKLSRSLKNELKQICREILNVETLMHDNYQLRTKLIEGLKSRGMNAIFWNESWTDLDEIFLSEDDYSDIDYPDKDPRICSYCKKKFDLIDLIDFFNRSFLEKYWDTSLVLYCHECYSYLREFSYRSVAKKVFITLHLLPLNMAFNIRENMGHPPDYLKYTIDPVLCFKHVQILHNPQECELPYYPPKWRYLLKFQTPRFKMAFGKIKISDNQYNFISSKSDLEKIVSYLGIHQYCDYEETNKKISQYIKKIGKPAKALIKKKGKKYGLKETGIILFYELKRELEEAISSIHLERV